MSLGFLNGSFYHVCSDSATDTLSNQLPNESLKSEEHIPAMEQKGELLKSLCSHRHLMQQQPCAWMSHTQLLRWFSCKTKHGENTLCRCFPIKGLCLYKLTLRPDFEVFIFDARQVLERMSGFISPSLIHTQHPFPLFTRLQLSNKDTMSVFGLVSSNSNEHDVITIIKQTLSIFGFRSRLPSAQDVLIRLVIKLTAILSNFQLAARQLYKAVWPSFKAHFMACFVLS